MTGQLNAFERAILLRKLGEQDDDAVGPVARRLTCPELVCSGPERESCIRCRSGSELGSWRTCCGIAQQHGLTLVELAIGWLRSRWFVGSIIVGATSLAQLEESIAASEVDLDRETLAEIEAVQLRFPNPAP